MNGRHGAQRVSVQTGMSINRTVDGPPDAVIVRGNRQHFDPMVGFRDTLRLLDDLGGRRLQRRPGASHAVPGPQDARYE